MGPALDNWQFKLRRAEEHVETIKKEIDTWRNSSPYRLIRQANADFTRHGLIIKVNTSPDLIRWSLILSDVVHNLRCTLDHLVYAVAIHESGSNPPPLADKLAFPICDGG